MLYADCMYEELKELREATSQLMENLAPNRLTQEMLERVRVALQGAYAIDRTDQEWHEVAASVADAPAGRAGNGETE